MRLDRIEMTTKISSWKLAILGLQRRLTLAADIGPQGLIVNELTCVTVELYNEQTSSLQVDMALN